MPRWVVACAVLMPLLGITPAHSQAQDWPNKPVRIIVPVSAGSATDVTARIIADHLQQQLGQPFIVENRTGAGGMTGTGYVAKQVEPDGYNILIHSAAFALQPSTFPNLGYDSGKDFAGITLLSMVPLVMVAQPEKYKSLSDLVKVAKAKPNSVNFSTVGYGASSHLAAERFRLAAGYEAQQIPFRGAPEALNEVLAGRADYFFSPALPAVPLIRGGRLIGLATSSSKRAQVLPDVPTTVEAGYPNSTYNFWLGMWAPSKTPQPIIEKLYAETRKLLALPEVRQKMIALGNEEEQMTTAQFEKFYHDDIALNSELVKAAGIKPNE